MVVTEAPLTTDIGVEQARTGLPFTCMVQAPHIATPQPNLLPVSLASSRTNQSNGLLVSPL